MAVRGLRTGSLLIFASNSAPWFYYKVGPLFDEPQPVRRDG
jgi:hypothetical protein